MAEAYGALEGPTPAQQAVTGPIDRDRIAEALATCRDPEIGLDIMSLGLVYGVDISDEQKVHIRMTLTAIGCPWAQELFDEVKAKVEEIPGVNESPSTLCTHHPGRRT